MNAPCELNGICPFLFLVCSHFHLDRSDPHVINRGHYNVTAGFKSLVAVFVCGRMCIHFFSLPLLSVYVYGFNFSFDNILARRFLSVLFNCFL